MLRLPGIDALDFLPPPEELGMRDSRLVYAVDNVVDFAAERIECGDATSLVRRQKQEAVIETGAALRHLLAAVIVGRHPDAAIRRGTIVR